MSALDFQTFCIECGQTNVGIIDGMCSTCTFSKAGNPVAKFFERMCAIDPEKEKEILTEVSDGGGTFRAVNEKGEVRVIYGERFREAISKLK